MSEILTVADNQDGVNVTRIMYRAFLSTTQVKYYLKRLLDSELILYDGKYKLYKTTNKGLRLIELSKKMVKMIPEIS